MAWEFGTLDWDLLLNYSSQAVEYWAVPLLLYFLLFFVRYFALLIWRVFSPSKGKV